MGIKICKNPHRYNPQYSHLPDNQGQTGRHRCAACAYELGVLHAMIGIPKAKEDSFLANIPYSQAGTVRHKDAFEAYMLGYDYAMSSALLKAA